MQMRVYDIEPGTYYFHIRVARVAAGFDLIGVQTMEVIETRLIRL